MNCPGIWIAGIVTLMWTCPIWADQPARRANARAERSVAEQTSQPAAVNIKHLTVTGTIEKANISFTIEFDAEVEKPNQEIPLIFGQVTLAELAQPKAGYTLRYDANTSTYYM